MKLKNNTATLSSAYKFNLPKLGNIATLKNVVRMMTSWLHNNARNTLLIRVFSFVKF